MKPSEGETTPRSGEQCSGGNGKSYPSSRTRYILVSLFCCLAVIAVLCVLCFFIPHPTREPSKGEPEPRKPPKGEPEAWKPSKGGPAGAPRRIIRLQASTPPPTVPTQLYSIHAHNLLFVMHGPSGEPGNFTPLYDSQEEYTFCTVIAGTEGFGISGRGTNGAMADMIVQLSRGEYTREAVQQMTQSMQAEAAALAKSTPGKIFTMYTHWSPFFSHLHAYYEPHSAKNVHQDVAVPILAIFNEQYYPRSNYLNRFLMYVVSPRGSVPTPDFEEAYRATYTNLLKLLHRYNQSTSYPSLQIERVRIPLLSGGIYRGQRSATDLGIIAAKAMLDWMVKEKPAFVLDLSYDASNSLFVGLRKAAFEQH